VEAGTNELVSLRQAVFDAAGSTIGLLEAERVRIAPLISALSNCCFRRGDNCARPPPCRRLRHAHAKIITTLPEAKARAKHAHAAARAGKTVAADTRLHLTASSCVEARY